LALALFANCHAPYSDKLSNCSEYGLALGLGLACLGICGCYLLMLCESFGVF
jgi:hypothetical protein